MKKGMGRRRRKLGQLPTLVGLGRRKGKGKKVCLRYKRTAAGKRCAKFGSPGAKGKAKARKPRCLKWSKGRTKCLKRAKS